MGRFFFLKDLVCIYIYVLFLWRGGLVINFLYLLFDRMGICVIFILLWIISNNVII